MFFAGTKQKGRSAVAALLQRFTISALLLCSSAPALAVAVFSADAKIEVSVTADPDNLRVVIPTNAALTGTEAEKSPANADATAVATADAIAGYEDETLALFAEAQVSGSATSGSAMASAFGSALAYLRNLTGAAFQIDIFVENALIQTLTETPSPGDYASAAAGWIVSLTLGGEDVYLTPNPTGWSVNLLPYDIPSSDLKNEYLLSVYAAAEGTARVPEPATLALFGLGLAGIGAVRRRKLAA